MTAVQGGKFWSGAASGAFSSIASSAFTGGFNLDSKGGAIPGTGFGGAGNFSKNIGGLLAFGAISGGAGSLIGGGNFWQGAVTGLVVSGLNHAMHSGDDNGYDTDGNKVNNKGGDETDYLYDDNGKIIKTTSVSLYGPNEGGFNLDGTPAKLTMRGFGVKSYTATGACNQDNSIFEFYAGGKVIGAGLNYLGKGLSALKVPFARYAGAYIGEFAPGLNKGAGLRIGISKANIPGGGGTKMVFRATYGNNQNHFFNIIIGKWGG
jgi:hypothetical protein